MKYTSLYILQSELYSGLVYTDFVNGNYPITIYKIGSIAGSNFNTL